MKNKCYSEVGHFFKCCLDNRSRRENDENKCYSRIGHSGTQVACLNAGGFGPQKFWKESKKKQKKATNTVYLQSKRQKQRNGIGEKRQREHICGWKLFSQFLPHLIVFLFAFLIVNKQYLLLFFAFFFCLFQNFWGPKPPAPTKALGAAAHQHNMATIHTNMLYNSRCCWHMTTIRSRTIPIMRTPTCCIILGVAAHQHNMAIIHTNMLYNSWCGCTPAQHGYYSHQYAV